MRYSVPSRKSVGIRPALHPGWLRCSSLRYSRYPRSSRLAIRAHRCPRCATHFQLGTLGPPGDSCDKRPSMAMVRGMETDSLSAAGRLLCDCLSQHEDRVSRERLARLSPDAWQSLLATAHVQKVSALLYHRLISRGWAAAVAPA